MQSIRLRVQVDLPKDVGQEWFYEHCYPATTEPCAQELQLLWLAWHGREGWGLQAQG